jgi:hypothetical protein
VPTVFRRMAEERFEQQMATPEPTKSPKPLPFNHPGRPVYILGPVDNLDLRPCKEYLDEVFSTLETPPILRQEIRVGRLPSTAVLYVIHPVIARKKNESTGKFEMTKEVHLSSPLELKNFTLIGIDGDDALGSININAIADAVTAMCQNTRAGLCFTARLSAEKDPNAKTLKLSNA